VEEEAVGRPPGTGGQLVVGQQGSRRARRPIAKRRERERERGCQRAERKRTTDEHLLVPDPADTSSRRK
jgi:hypothetical protein